MSSKQGLSIILPVYNEEKDINNVVASIIKNIPGHIPGFEIILVNDGSTDKTKDILRSLSARYAALRIANNAVNQGYGAAIKKGIAKAEKEWLLIMDGDGQFRIDDLEVFWNEKSNYDFIIGFRKKRRDNLYRTLLGAGGNLLANLRLGTNIFIKDINCGFKLFKTQDLKTIRLLSTGGLISFEILYKLLKRKRMFIQLPVAHYKRKTGKSTGGRLITIIKIIGEFFRSLNEASREKAGIAIN